MWESDHEHEDNHHHQDLSESGEEESGRVRKSATSKMGTKEEKDDATAIAIWFEDVVIDPGVVRFPIRVVLVDNHFRTRLDCLVQLPKSSITLVYRVLDHGIPWQHLIAGLTLDEVRKQILNLVKGKRLVVFDAWKTLEIFNFTAQQISRLKIFDLKTRGNESNLTFWNLVRQKLGHIFSGKPGNYDAIELADFIMSIYIKHCGESKSPSGDKQESSNTVRINQ